MTSRSILNIGILIAVIALGFIAFYPAEKEPPPMPTVQLLPLNKGDVQTLSIVGTDNAELHFSKQDQQWFMIVPVQVRAGEHQITTLLNILDQPGDRRLPIEGSDLSKYGLDAPVFSVQFNGLPIAIGGTDPIHQRRYVMSQDAVYLIDDSFSRWLREGAGAFIDPELLPPGSIISKIQLPEFEVSKTETQWQYSATIDNSISKDNDAETDKNALNGSATKNTKHFSQDSLQMFIDEWRYGRALQVSILAAPYKHSKGRQINVYLQNQAEPIVFYEEQSAQDTAFVRADLNIRYQLTKDTEQRLTKVTQPQDIETDPEPVAEPNFTPATAL